MLNTLNHIVIVTAIAVAPSQALAQSSVSPAQQPNGPWKTNYADNECQLTRSFGAGNDEIGLRIARGASLDTYDMLLLGNTVPLYERRVKITMRAEPLALSTDVQASPYILKGEKFRILRWFDVSEDFLSKLDDQQTLSFAIEKKNITLAPKGMKKALAALQACHDDLLVNVFKLDIAALRSLQSPPIPENSPAMWVTSDDYPKAAFANRQQGTTQFTVMVDENGKASDCRVIITSGFPILDQTACALILKRGRFKPAIDKDGKPTRAVWLRNVRWMIPK